MKFQSVTCSVVFLIVVAFATSIKADELDDAITTAENAIKNANEKKKVLSTYTMAVPLKRIT